MEPGFYDFVLGGVDERNKNIGLFPFVPTFL
jgi:hypothetical protein